MMLPPLCSLPTAGLGLSIAVEACLMARKQLKLELGEFSWQQIVVHSRKGVNPHGFHEEIFRSIMKGLFRSKSGLLDVHSR